jgi:hypothetical protein
MAPADRLLGWPASAARPADPSALPRAGRKRSRVVESVPQRRHCPAEHAGQDGARSHASLPQQLRGHRAPVAPARTREGIGNPRVPPGCCLGASLLSRSVRRSGGGCRVWRRGTFIAQPLETVFQMHIYECPVSHFFPHGEKSVSRAPCRIAFGGPELNARISNWD